MSAAVVALKILDKSTGIAIGATGPGAEAPGTDIPEANVPGVDAPQWGQARSRDPWLDKHKNGGQSLQDTEQEQNREQIFLHWLMDRNG